jgi:two-component sensor histidine kinase
VAAENHIDLSIAREQMLQHILQIEDLAALQERQRIARDIHDSLGNALTSLNIQLQTAHKLWRLDPTLAEKFLSEAQRLGAIAIKEVRQSVSNMREIVPLEESLTALIDSLVENFYQVTGILPSTKINLPVPLSTEVVKTLYRIIQEALTNICKYARATKVEINLNHTHENLTLIIRDNGKGFKLSQKRTGFGLQGMQERVLALKGNFKIDTEPGYGCRIIINLPLKHERTWEQPPPEEDISLENADTIPPVNPDITEFNLENADTIPPQSISTIDCNFTNDDTTPLEELSAIEFNLKLIDTTIQQNNSAKTNNLNLLQTIPLAETIEEDANLELVETIPLAETIEENSFSKTNQPSVDWKQTPLFFFPATNAEIESNVDNLLNDHELLSKIEQDLAKLIGPIAYYLVQKVLKSSPEISQLELIKKLASEITAHQKVVTAFSYQEIIDKLSVHLASNKQISFKQPSKVPKSEPSSQPQAQSKTEPSKNNQPISENFIHQCEQDLAEFIGPIATFLVKKAVKPSLQISRAELIKMLAAQIPDSGKAAQFRQRLLA